MSTHDDDTCPHLVRASLLEAENARLKAEVERLTQRLGGVRLIVTEEMYDELNTKYLEQQHELHNIALTARQILDEKIDLKAEVERLTAFTTRTIIPNEELEAQVERLSAELSNITGWGRGLESDLCRARAELMLEKAEVERIRLIAHDNKQALYNANAQVERLTKAGDAMVEDYFISVDNWTKIHRSQFDKDIIIQAWQAAKEGKQP